MHIQRSLLTLFLFSATVLPARAQFVLAETGPVFGGDTLRAPNGDLIRFGNNGYGLPGSTANAERGRIVRLGSDFGSRQNIELYPSGLFRQRIYGGDVDAQSGLLLSGQAQLTETSHGQAWVAGYTATMGLLWDLTLTPGHLAGGAFDIADAPGGIWVCGFLSSDDADVLLSRIDPSGAIIWQRVFDLGDTEIARDVVPTQDGGAVVTGSSGYDTFVLRVDANGSVLWAHRVQLSGVQNSIPAVVLPSGDIVVTANYQGALSLEHPWVARFDAAGNLLWQTEYPAQLSGPVQDIAGMPDGGVLLQGWRSSGNPKTCLTRLDAGGGALWQKVYSYGSAQYIYGGGVETDAAGRILTGWGLSTLGNLLLGNLLQLDPDGLTTGCSSVSSDLPAFPQPGSATLSPVVPVLSFVPGTGDDHHVVAVPISLPLSVLCGDPCSASRPYCPTSPNSVGGGAQILGMGTTSVSANEFELAVYDAPPQKPGIFFYSPNVLMLPFGDGLRCVGSPAFRLPVTFSDAAGYAEHQLDMLQPPTPAAQITPGSTWHFQFWYRDPQGGPAGFNLSNAIVMTACD